MFSSQVFEGHSGIRQPGQVDRARKRMRAAIASPWSQMLTFAENLRRYLGGDELSSLLRPTLLY